MIKVWNFRTDKFNVILTIKDCPGYKFDGDDKDSEIQRQLDDGTLTAFDAAVTVYLNGREIGRDSLCGLIYRSVHESEFWTAHRDPNPLNRDCTLRIASDEHFQIYHEFPEMVRGAIADVRKTLRDVPKLRA